MNKTSKVGMKKSSKRHFKFGLQSYNVIVHVLRILLVLVLLVICLFPVYWMLITSIKSQHEIYQRVPTFFPQNPTLDGYTTLFETTNYLQALGNSFLIALFCATFSILICYPASYAIARVKFTGRKNLARLILACYLIPSSILYIPLFLLVSKVGLTNTLWGLMLIYPTLTIPYAAWMLIPHIQSIPVDIEEAAIVDGCGRLRSMYQIVLPLALPGVMTTFIFSFSLCWGEYLYALVNITSTENKTFPLIISGLIYGDLYPWDQIMAGAIIACIPILILYIFSSSFIEGGLVSGGVKG